MGLPLDLNGHLRLNSGRVSLVRKPSVLNFVFKVGVLLSALGIFASYIRHTQREADGMRAELSEVKKLLLQQNAGTATRSVSTLPILTGVRLSESSSPPDFKNAPERPRPLSDTSAAIADLVAKSPVSHFRMMAGSKSATVFQTSWIKIEPAPEALKLSSVEAESINSLITQTDYRQRNGKYAMMGSSKSLVLAPTYPVSTLQWLFDLNPQKKRTSSEGDGSFILRKKAGLSEQDLDKLWKREQPLPSIPTTQP